MWYHRAASAPYWRAQWRLLIPAWSNCIHFGISTQIRYVLWIFNPTGRACGWRYLRRVELKCPKNMLGTKVSGAGRRTCVLSFVAVLTDERYQFTHEHNNGWQLILNKPYSPMKRTEAEMRTIAVSVDGRFPEVLAISAPSLGRMF